MEGCHSVRKRVIKCVALCDSSVIGTESNTFLFIDINQAGKNDACRLNECS